MFDTELIKTRFTDDPMLLINQARVCSFLNWGLNQNHKCQRLSIKELDKVANTVLTLESTIRSNMKERKLSRVLDVVSCLECISIVENSFQKVTL